jgi:very-short-patch-repair endonuclease
VSLTKLARSLRKHMTHEEVKLWVQLKHFNSRGYNFRHQAPTDGYILDFAEFNCKLILEVDGSQHSEGEVKARDEIRDAYFRAKGFTVLRFWNFQVNQEMDGVIDHITSVLPATPPARLRRSTSPKGEDEDK